jgi:hypothetical protein
MLTMQSVAFARPTDDETAAEPHRTCFAGKCFRYCPGAQSEHAIDDHSCPIRRAGHCAKTPNACRPRRVRRVA